MEIALRRRNILRQVLLTIGVATGSLNMGLALGWCSPALSDLLSVDSKPCDRITLAQSGWVGSLLSLGAMLQVPIFGIMMEKLGRKRFLMITAVPIGVGWMLISFGTTLLQIYISRILIGFSAGIVLMYCSGLVLKWNELGYIGISVTVASFIISLIIPETPVWLARQGRLEEARVVLKWLQSTDDDSKIENEIINFEESKTCKGNGPLFRHPTVIKPVLLISMIILINQANGISVIITFQNEIFSSAGVDLSSRVSSVIVGISMLISTIASFFAVRSFDRKPLLVSSLMMMSVAMTGFGMYFYFTPGPKFNWVPIICLLAFIIPFCLGPGPLTWILLSDLSIPQAAAAVGSVASLLNWGFAFIFTTVFGGMEEMLGKCGVFWFYGFSSIIGGIFVLLFLPETRGKSRREIEQMLM
ncbi:facilitated trehalose transporter Tret1 isoform X2 [Eurytemora carolleeae]|uniref:facilitated trehalose transporter Tret1 isoform X2 n=1 Tax=Eurytemora carolleeae TaxID=1294199 RepID=UPI000C792095|nr:facilitated trehalose transporter Tret1 isoform X2 [Eurytemora carolleeae]|eukprot:XP_023331546.1 facilitated trehalose transporter Tret1-like isoform X2 [Eurytemora affinis]